MLHDFESLIIFLLYQPYIGHKITGNKQIAFFFFWYYFAGTWNFNSGSFFVMLGNQMTTKWEKKKFGTLFNENHILSYALQSN